MKEDRLKLRPIATRLSLVHYSAMEFYAKQKGLKWTSASTLLRAIVEDWLQESGWDISTLERTTSKEKSLTAVLAQGGTQPIGSTPVMATTQMKPFPDRHTILSAEYTKQLCTTTGIALPDVGKSYDFFKAQIETFPDVVTFLTTHCPVVHDECDTGRLTTRLASEPFTGFSCWLLTKIEHDAIADMPMKLWQSITRIATTWETQIKSLRPISDVPTQTGTAPQEDLFTQLKQTAVKETPEEGTPDE